MPSTGRGGAAARVKAGAEGSCPEKEPESPENSDTPREGED